VKRATTYIRESTEEQGQNWAPHVQRKAVDRLIAEREWQQMPGYQDFVSGRNAEKRPGFQQMLADARDGRFDVIVVYHSSRFARNVAEARRIKTWLRKKCGVEVVSVTQHFGDSERDPSAFLMESINEVLDEHYSRNLGFLISGGLQEKQSQGYLVGSLPFGLVRPHPGERRECVQEPKEAATIRTMYEQYANGKESYGSLADWLNDSGYRGRRGKPFTKDSVREILCNATYAGFVTAKRAGIGTERAKGKFERIVSPELFEKVRTIREKRTITKHGTRPTHQRHVYLLSGTAVCARCGAKLYGSRGGRGNRFARYVCSTRSRRGKCDQRFVLARELEPQLSDFLSDFKLSEAQVAEVLELVRTRAAARVARPSGLSSAKTTRRLERLKDLYELGDLSRTEYLNRKQKVQSLAATAPPPVAVDSDRCLQLLRNFKDLWEGEDDEREKQQFVGIVFDRIGVDNGQIVEVRPHPENLPFFTERRGVYSGSDGTRTRGLRRDRPAL
jgi:site-specific DNA recombinase